MSLSTILEKITEKDLLELATQIKLPVAPVADRLFPNIKTEYLEAEYIRLANSPSLPHAAKVHAFDTEALIGVRPALEIVKIEQLLVKEKINLTENLQRYLSRGVRDNAAIDYALDDMSNMVRSVKTRTDVAKFEVLTTGAMTINENNVVISVPYGVPAGNKVTKNWSNTSYDILGDLQTLTDAARANGYPYNKIITSTKVLRYFTGNSGIQSAINGTLMAGVLISKEQLTDLFNRLFGIDEIIVDDSYYTYTATDGTETTARMFTDTICVLDETGSAGDVGVGLWGATPEELNNKAFETSGFSNFIYLSQWVAPDPVATWTKASGVFIPVLPAPKGIAIVTTT